MRSPHVLPHGIVDVQQSSREALSGPQEITNGLVAYLTTVSDHHLWYGRAVNVLGSRWNGPFVYLGPPPWRWRSHGSGFMHVRVAAR